MPQVWETINNMPNHCGAEVPCLSQVCHHLSQQATLCLFLFPTHHPFFMMLIAFGIVWICILQNTVQFDLSLCSEPSLIFQAELKFLRIQ